MENKKTFFNKFFLYLERNKISYTILRNSSFISNKDSFGEIDLLVKNKDLKKLKKIIEANPWCNKTNETIDLTHPLLVLVKGEDFICFLDFQVDGVGYCGAPILRESFLLKNSKREKSFFVLNDSAYLLMLFVHNFIFKREKKHFNKYKKEFYKIFKTIDKKKLKDDLKSLFGNKNSEEIIEGLSKKNFEKLNSMKKKLILKHLSKNPFDLFKIIYSKAIRFMNYFHIWSLFYFLNPFKLAPLVSFVGTDGSGKSTLGKKLKKELDLMEIKNKIISAGVFSRIKFIKRKEKSYSKKVGSLGKENLNLRFEIVARLLLQISLQLKIFYLRKKGIFVITDRYVYDIVTLFGVKGFWKKVVKFLFQKPNKTFYIYSSAESIYSRNKELSINYIKSVQNSFEKNIDFLNLHPIKNEELLTATKKILSENWKIIKNGK